MTFVKLPFTSLTSLFILFGNRKTKPKKRKTSHFLWVLLELLNYCARWRKNKVMRNKIGYKFEFETSFLQQLKQTWVVWTLIDCSQVSAGERTRGKPLNKKQNWKWIIDRFALLLLLFTAFFSCSSSLFNVFFFWAVK